MEPLSRSLEKASCSVHEAGSAGSSKNGVGAGACTVTGLGLELASASESVFQFSVEKRFTALCLIGTLEPFGTTSFVRRALEAFAEGSSAEGTAGTSIYGPSRPQPAIYVPFGKELQCLRAELQLDFQEPPWVEPRKQTTNHMTCALKGYIYIYVYSIYIFKKMYIYIYILYFFEIL